MQAALLCGLLCALLLRPAGVRAQPADASEKFVELTDELIEQLDAVEYAREQLLLLASNPHANSQLSDEERGALDRIENTWSFATLIRALYEKHNPAKLDSVDGLLAKYQGMEELLLDSVREKCKSSSLASVASSSEGSSCC